MKVNDIITFGTYPQTKYTDEVSPLEWKVLKVEDGKALIITGKVIDQVRFNEKYADATWADSILRGWLNDEFYNKAFTADEKEKILTTAVSTPDNDKWGTKGGEATEDKVFALSIQELEELLPELADRKAEPTGKALENGVYVYTETGYSVWWLRSSGYVQYAGSRVGAGGHIEDKIYDDVRPHRGARPAMWIKTN